MLYIDTLDTLDTYVNHLSFQWLISNHNISHAGDQYSFTDLSVSATVRHPLIFFRRICY